MRLQIEGKFMFLSKVPCDVCVRIQGSRGPDYRLSLLNASSSKVHRLHILHNASLRDAVWCAWCKSAGLDTGPVSFANDANWLILHFQEAKQDCSRSCERAYYERRHETLKDNQLANVVLPESASNTVIPEPDQNSNNPIDFKDPTIGVTSPHILHRYSVHVKIPNATYLDHKCVARE